ncbi:hypothetical protein AAP_00252 [Ascosphaera apis ARSEF 7405]|uniref:Uncharacterized protein n=1 Tax=Ascosphaera apis ARSEF 7405 TaxID=392613 RepID=A0A168DQ64_9EURO|nr:hypothetical protein AAP_00252 [Ascosphaera apis ARSEF 7405]
MPMVWNAENNSKLLGIVLRDTKLKLTKDDMARYAEQMGDGCTEQAVYFQIYKLKKAGDTSQGGSSPKKRGRKGQYELKGTTKKVKQEVDVKPVAAPVKNEEGDDGETRAD